MKSVKHTIVALAALCLLPLTASAHHQGGSVGELIEQAQLLDSIVQSTWLRPNVKWSVRYFVNAANQLASCDAGAPVDSPLAHHLGGCEMQVQQAQMYWNRVANYLYDTNFDFPQVYNQYLVTQSAFQDAMAELSH